MAAFLAMDAIMAAAPEVAAAMEEGLLGEMSAGARAATRAGALNKRLRTATRVIGGAAAVAGILEDSARKLPRIKGVFGGDSAHSDERSRITTRDFGTTSKELFPDMPKNGGKAMTASVAKRRLRAERKKRAKPAKRKKSAKKTKSKKKKVRNNVAKEFDTHGVIQRNDVSWFGFQAHGGHVEMFHTAMEGVLRAILRKCRITIRSPDEPLFNADNDHNVRYLRIDSRRHNYAFGTDGGSVDDVIDLLGGRTLSVVVADLGSKLKSRAVAGYFPHTIQTFNHNSSTPAVSNQLWTDRKFGETQLNCSAVVKIDLRNVTPNDSAGTDRFALDTNPLDGKMYKFRGEVPRVKEGLYSTDTAEFSKFHDRECTRGLAFGPQRSLAGDHDGTVGATPLTMQASKVLRTPPSGSKVFSNCTSTRSVHLVPGQVLRHKMRFAFSGSLRDFMRKFYGVDYSMPMVGVCHWLCLEQKFKNRLQVANDAHTGVGHNHVAVEYDLQTVQRAGAAFAPAERSIRTVESTAGHNSIQS